MDTRHSVCLTDTLIRKKIESYSDDFWASVGRDPREDVHAYLQYPAMMVSGIQRELIQIVCQHLPGVKEVLDPFVGAGTTMTACMMSGLNFTGQDINPLAILVSRTKAGPLAPLVLSRCAQRIFRTIEDDSSDEVDAGFAGIDKWFRPPVKVDLSRICRAIRAEELCWIRRFFWVALSETVRLTSDSRTSTYKLHLRPQAEIEARVLSASETFRNVALRNLNDLERFADSLSVAGYLQHDHYVGNLSLHLQDSTQGVSPCVNAEGYDLLMTSPPYGDNTSTVPYGQFSFLPLQWVDFEDVDAEAEKGAWLRTIQEIDRRSLGGANPRNFVAIATDLAERSATFGKTIGSLGSQPRDRAARVTMFLFDLDRTLGPVVQSLRNDAYMIWIVGNRHVGGMEIPTDQILCELLASRRVEPVACVPRKIMFRRMATRNRIACMMREENIMVFRKRGG